MRSIKAKQQDKRLLLRQPRTWVGKTQRYGNSTGSSATEEEPLDALRLFKQYGLF